MIILFNIFIENFLFLVANGYKFKIFLINKSFRKIFLLRKNLIKRLHNSAQNV
jgi:hypothetical protein